MMTKAVEALSTNEEIQDVGVDIGRGCVKAFSKFKGKTYQYQSMYYEASVISALCLLYRNHLFNRIGFRQR